MDITVRLVRCVAIESINKPLSWYIEVMLSNENNDRKLYTTSLVNNCDCKKMKLVGPYMTRETMLYCSPIDKWKEDFRSLFE